MKKSIFKYLLLLVLAASLIFTLASCDFLKDILPEGILPVEPSEPNEPNDPDIPSIPGEPTEAPDLSDVIFESKTVTYDGKYHELAIPQDQIPAGVAVLYSTNKHMNAGTYTVTADFYWGGAKVEGASKSATLTINKASYDVSGVTITGLTKIYDGEAVEIEAEGKIPAGVTVGYVYKDEAGNEVEEIVDAGKYTVYATFAADTKNFHPISPISAEVEIRKATVGRISFSDAQYVYDGEAKSILIAGTLPVGVTVSYEGNGQTEKGDYTVTATFDVGKNYEAIAPMTAVMHIIKLSHDMSGVSLLGQTVTYDGQSHVIAIDGTLPEGVRVSYVITDSTGAVVNDIVNVGVYTVTASFSGNPTYETIEDMVATVTVNKATVPALQFSDAQFTYDDTPKTVEVVGTLPADVSVEYVIVGESGETVSEIRGYGVYTVTAKFTVTGNYEPIDDMTATVTVVRHVYDMSGVSLPSSTVTYDGASKTPTVVGTLPEGVTVSYAITDAQGNVVEDIVDIGTYTVVASFVGANPYAAPIDSMTATVVVKEATVDGIEFKDATLSYDGTAKSISVSGLPSFVTVAYTGNGKINPGTYVVTATFTTDGNVEPIAPMTAVMTIEMSNPLDYVTTTLTYEKVAGGYAVTGITDSTAVVVIPATYEGESVVAIKSNAFRGTALEYVYIPETVASVGNAAFKDCTGLSDVRFAEFSVSVGTDGDLVTNGASALTLIGQLAFANTAITVVDLPDSVTAIGYGAFEGCTKVTKMTLPFIGGSATTTHAYLGYLFGADAAETASFKVPATLEEVIISDNCTEIPANAFMNLASLKSVYVGKSVTKIGNGAFRGCTGLKDIYLPASVTAITASASASNSPFWGCPDDLMIVIENVASTGSFGQYYCAISEGKSALVVFNKSYEDYVMNKDSYRVADPADSSAAAIYAGGVLVGGFTPSTLTYTVPWDINLQYPTVTALASASTATIEITQAVAGVAKVKVTSGNGMSITTYTITFTESGEFTSSSEIVGKDGSKGTVSFVIDDGFIGTGEFTKSMLEKYPTLAVTFGIMTKKFATFNTEDLDGDGIKEYVKDADGKYTYTTETETVDFWRDILSSAPGRSEIVAHSHTHAYWGYNDDGGSMFAIGNSSGTIGKNPTTLAKGSATAEMYGAQQIVKDLFGDLGSRAITFITPGIAVTGTTKNTSKDVNILLRGHIVRLVNDTAVNLVNGELQVNSAAEIDLTTVKLTIPAGTPISTTATYENNVIPAGTVITVEECSMVVPAGTQILGHGDYWAEIYDKAYEEGVMIAARNTISGKTYTKSELVSVDTRQKQLSLGVATSDPNRDISDWLAHIDNAVTKGGWSSYCIHAITATLDSSVENQGGHMITMEQGEALFSHAVDYGDDLWIATYTDATLYYHEWSTATVTESYNSADGTISVSLTDNERDDIYNMPLTVKVKVPGTWTSALTSTGTALDVRANADGTAYVYVNVAPESTVVLCAN